MIEKKTKLFPKPIVSPNLYFLIHLIIIHTVRFMYMQIRFVLYKVTMEMFFRWVKTERLTPRYFWDFMDYNFDISTLKEEPIEFYVKHQSTVGANYATSFLSYGENSKYYITSFRLKKENTSLNH